MREVFNYIAAVIVMMTLFDAIAAYKNSDKCPIIMEKELYYAGPGYLIGCAAAGFK